MRAYRNDQALVDSVKQARFYTAVRTSHAIWVVLHATCGSEGTHSAEDGAHELATLPPDTPRDKQRSVNYFVDADTVVQCVALDARAWHAGHTANEYGVGIEVCGRADQTRAQWFDDASFSTLCLTAAVLKYTCTRLGIPLEFRSATELRAHVPGVTTHAEVTRAFPKDTTHTDPGGNFPLAELLEAARA